MDRISSLILNSRPKYLRSTAKKQHHILPNFYNSEMN